jgi:hypothetical protein
MAREREQLPVSPPSVVLGYFGAAVARHPWLVLLSVTGPIALQLATLATGWYMRDFFNLLVLPAGTVSEGVFLRVIVLLFSVVVPQPERHEAVRHFMDNHRKKQYDELKNKEEIHCLYALV